MADRCGCSILFRITNGESKRNNFRQPADERGVCRFHDLPPDF
jgi:hypothetical protein